MHISPRAVLAAIVLCALQFAFGTNGLVGQTAAAEPENGEISFRRTATVFLAKHCGDCHGEISQEADLRFDKLAYDLSEQPAAAMWERILTQVRFREMPPEDSTQPTPRDRNRFINAVESELVKQGHGTGLADKLLLPQFGNYVDHELLFSGQIQDPPYTPARLWRTRPDIYDGVWRNQYGLRHWLSVKIGNQGRAGETRLVQHGPHKGRIITTRYFATAQYANPFYEFVHHASGITDYASISADEASLEALLTNAEKMAEVLTVGTPVGIVTEVKSKDSRHGNNHGSFVGGVQTNHVERRGMVPTAFKKIVDSKTPAKREDFAAAVDVAFGLLLRRPASPADVDHYWKDVFQKNAEFGNTMALQAVLIHIALSPEFVYRMELGLGEPDEHGRRMLSPRELVYAIHHAFYDTPAFPSVAVERTPIYQKESEPAIKKVLSGARSSERTTPNWLVTEMREGRLKTRKDVERSVRKILAERDRTMFPNHNSTISSTKHPRVLQFFREFFGYHKASTVFKDVEQFKKAEGFQQYHSHSPIRYMYDTDAVVLQILKEDRHVLEELLTTNRVYFSYSNTIDAVKLKQLGAKKYAAQQDAAAYNVNFLTADFKRGELYEVPKEQRCGVLTHPSWLIAHSGNFDNDPVRRGKWIREKLLAGTVMEVPITVDAQIPDDETKTLRERFSKVREEYCWRCHKKMNPLGMPFEAYNHVGRFRELEKGKPVDTSGAIGHASKILDGDVANVREMMERLAKSPRVRQSFLRHVFRYWMGRNETLSDSRTLIEMDKAYVESDGSFQEVLVALLTSDSFLLRK